MRYVLFPSLLFAAFTVFSGCGADPLQELENLVDEHAPVIESPDSIQQMFDGATEPLYLKGDIQRRIRANPDSVWLEHQVDSTEKKLDQEYRSVLRLRISGGRPLYRYSSTDHLRPAQKDTLGAEQRLYRALQQHAYTHHHKEKNQ